MAERLGYGLQIRLQRFNSASHLQFLTMITFWGFVLGLPLLAFGGAALYSPSLSTRFTEWFCGSKPFAAVLTALAWIWTAYECDTIGIDAFDAVTKIFPGQLWIMAVVLTYLVIIWMPKNLPVRALTGILMLIPAELFKTTHLYRPPVGTWFASIDVFVVVAYVLAVIGMYGMFHPERLEKGLALVLSRAWCARTMGAVCVGIGLALVVIGCSL